MISELKARGARWCTRRLFPLLAAAGLILIGMATTTLAEPKMLGTAAWSLPDDLWGTMVAAQRLVHLHPGGLYTQPTALITFPGAAVVLAPLVALTDAAGLSLAHQSPGNGQPVVWLVAGPYTIAISAVALLAADALAERMEASRVKRAFLAGAGALLLWSVAVEWGHPEDAIAVGLLLFAILGLSGGRHVRAGWLTGLAIAVQPLVLLAVPIMLATLQARRLAGFLGRAAAPAAALLGVAAAANWGATLHAVTSQPNWPAVDHPTPWTPLAPHLAGGAVAGGPGRVVAVLLACAFALVVRRTLASTRTGDPWTLQTLRDLLWWTAAALAVRCAFEPVMVAFYLWPGLAVALIASTWNWRALITTSAMAVIVSFGAQSEWRSPWGWWGLMVSGLALTLLLAGLPARRGLRPGRRRSRAGPGARPTPAPRMRGATAECRSTGPLHAAGQ